jgi:hypothetical protein
VVAYKDCLARFGFELIEYLIKSNGGELLVLDRIESSPQQELLQDLTAIFTVFSCRNPEIRKLRRYTDKIKKNNPPLEIKGNLYCHTIPEVELCGDFKEIKNALEQFKTAGFEPEYVLKPSIIPFLNETSLYGYLSVKKTIKGMGGKVKGTIGRFPRNAKCISFEDAKT